MSEWGHDFRPDYLRLATVIAELGHPPVMACTATATPKVADEIVARLGLRDAERVRSGFDRPNLSFDVLPFDGEGSGRPQAGDARRRDRDGGEPAGDRVLRDAQEHRGDRRAASAEGLRVAAYHAGMAAETRSARQDAFMRGDADVVVATNAFGMGVDKADVRSVWHWALPSSLEAYYQEAGRAGPRRPPPARCCSLALGPRAARAVHPRGGGDRRAGRGPRRPPARRAEGGAVELDASDDRDRIALAVAERTGALTLAPGAGGRIRVELSHGDVDRARAAALCRAAKDRRWQAYRSIERYAAGAESAAGASSSTTSATRRRVRRSAAAATSRPAGLAAARHRRLAPRAPGRRPTTARRSPTPISSRSRPGAASAPRASRPTPSRPTPRCARSSAAGRGPRPSCWRSRASAPRSSSKHADSLLELLRRG